MDKKTKIIIASGVVVLLIPFLGFPGGVENIINMIVGIFIAVFGYLSWSGVRPKNGVKKDTDAFSDNGQEFNNGTYSEEKVVQGGGVKVKEEN